jgi:hypothetical protein
MTTAANTSDRHDSLWIVTISPAVWAVHFLLSYTTAAVWCGMVAGRDGSLWTARLAIAGYTVVALAVILYVGWRGYKRNTAVIEAHGGDSPASRYRFLGFATLLLSGLSVVATLYTAMPALFFENCQ